MKMRSKQIVLPGLLLIVVLFSAVGCFLINTEPTASFSAVPTSGVAPFTVSFDASSSFDPDGHIASYHWILATGQTQEPKAASGRILSYTYDIPGTFNITLTVTDDKGKTASVSKTIVVRENLSPTASFSATPTTGEAPLAVAFDASTSADPDGSITSYAWSFGDGASRTRVTTSHTYNTPGTFNITLTVTDDKGKTGFATQTIYVSAPAETPDPDPEPTPSAAFEITDWTQNYYESLQEYGLVYVYYKATNTGTVDIDYYEVWIEVQCADGSTYQEWTNGSNVACGTYVTDYTLIDTADKRAVSVSITKYELTHD